MHRNLSPVKAEGEEAGAGTIASFHFAKKGTYAPL